MRTRKTKLPCVVVALLAIVPLLVGCHATADAGVTAGPSAPAWGGTRQDRVYRHAVVAADHPLASAAGAEILRLGGNAVDAAVATSFCLSVVRPYSCGIGGGGFMLIHEPPPAGSPGTAPVTVAIDYRETAPAVVSSSYYVDLEDPAASRFGVHGVGVPGTVAGLLYALREYGTLDRATVLAPAIRVAERGFAVDASHVKAAQVIGERLAAHPEHRASAAFLWEHLAKRGRIRVGDVIRNAAQAKALRLIAADGADAFYRGPIARAIVDVMTRGGGPIDAADLSAYTFEIRTPARSRFLDWEVLSMPPPSSGGIAMQQALGILERVAFKSGPEPAAQAGLAHNQPRYLHLLTEAWKHAFADRAEWLADPGFAAVPTERLLDPAYLDARAALVRPDHTQEPFAYGSVTAAGDDAGTSHISVIDGKGMAVACTETINMRFGSLVCVPEFGFVLNNEMDDFTTIPGQPNAYGLRQSDRNLPEPGKRPLSSMSPTIVLRDGRAVVIAGASGGPHIITGTMQAILNCLLFDMTPVDAVAAPRCHHQWMPDVLQFEETWTDTQVITDLERYGHRTGRREDVGVVQLISIGADGIRAASDPRKGGQPAGE